MAGREAVGADHQAERRQRRGGDAEAVALRVEVVRDVELVELAVVEEQLARGRDEDGGIIDLGSGALGEAGAEVDAVFRGGGRECLVRRAAGDWCRGFPGGRVGPAAVHRLRQDDHVGAFGRGAGDALAGAAEVGAEVAGLHVHLNEAEPEFRHRMSARKGSLRRYSRRASRSTLAEMTVSCAPASARTLPAWSMMRLPPT